MANKPLVFKTTAKAWVFDSDADTVTQITDAEYPATTVPGLVYLDGAWYVMTPDAEIYGSEIDTPTAWTALNFITAETETDAGIAIAKYLNYLVAFGQWTTEFFYNAAQEAPASPLLRAENMFLQVGCVSAKSINQCDNSIIWMGQTKENQSGASYGRAIMQLAGTKSRVISTPLIDSILMGDDLSTVHSLVFKYAGHSFYVLTLVTSNITLVYDLTTDMWYQWSSMTAQSPKSVTSLTYSSATGLAIATVASHGYADGDIITIAGADQSAYNTTENITYLTANTFSYPVSGSPVTPATGTITATGYTEGYFKLVKHTSTVTANLFADTSSGKLFAMAATDSGDSGVYINQLIRTQVLDGGNNEYKVFEAVDLIGDRVSGNALIRYSKDDYQSFSKYRKVDLSLVRSHLSRIGRARRISFDIRITDSVSTRLERMDIKLEGGE